MREEGSFKTSALLVDEGGMRRLSRTSGRRPYSLGISVSIRCERTTTLSAFRASISCAL